MSNTPLASKSGGKATRIEPDLTKNHGLLYSEVNSRADSVNACKYILNFIINIK